MGALVLAASWLLGGSVFFLPVWPLGVALLLAPFARWRAWPAGALALGGIAFAGALPAGTCVADPWSDAIPTEPVEDRRTRLALLAEAGGNGPQWSTGGGFASLRVSCPMHVLALGVMWDIALASMATLLALRAARVT